MMNIFEMEVKKAAVCLIAVLLVSAGAAEATYTETFDDSGAGWEATRINNNGSVIYPAATYHSSGGNTDGCISGSLGEWQPKLYRLDASFDTTPWGDMTGLALTTDFKIDGTVTGPASAMVRFYVGSYTGGNNYFVTNDSFSWNPNADASWTTHQVLLLASNFIRWPNEDASNKTFEQVTAATQDIGLIFTGEPDKFKNKPNLGFSGSGNLYLDNFGTVEMVPEPATVVLFGLGGLVLFRRR